MLRQGFLHVAGVDEVGRGAWAGPVVAAAVGLPLERRNLRRLLCGVRDSKQMSPDKRLEWEPRVCQIAWGCAVGQASVEEIESLGIVPATHLAMLRAAAGLRPCADYLLIDYLRLPGTSVGQLAFKFGDQFSLSIAAASVVAKVYRDQLMVGLDSLFPGYALAHNKGYGTAAHRAGLARQGPAAVHRRTFAPIARWLEAPVRPPSPQGATLGRLLVTSGS